MKKRKEQDRVIKERISDALQRALKKRGKTADEAAELLQVKSGTMYKYLSADMIPGGQVLWRACEHLGMVLDHRGFRLVGARSRRVDLNQAEQFELPLMNESVGNEKIKMHVRRKDSQFVQVQLRIKVAV